MFDDRKEENPPGYCTQNEETNDAATFSLELFPAGDDASGYRTKNAPSQPYQRSTVTERSGAIGARCDMIEVVHGSFGLFDGDDHDDQTPATLIILEFTFDSRKSARRIKAVEITFQFISRIGSDEEDPIVVRIEPAGSMVLVETSQPVDTKNNVSLNVGAPPIAGFQAGAAWNWEQDKSRIKHDSTRLVGSKRVLGRDYGDDNVASWVLIENPTESTGVPSLMRAAILLKRQHNFPFQCIFTMTLKADLKSSLESAFQTVLGRKVIDDPILFDPARKPTKRQAKLFDVNSLGSEDIVSLSRVISKTVLGDTVHHAGVS